MKRIPEAFPAGRFPYLLLACLSLVCVLSSCGRGQMKPVASTPGSPSQPKQDAAQGGESPSDASQPPGAEGESVSENAPEPGELEAEAPEDEGEEEERAPAPRDELVVSPPQPTPEEVERERTLVAQQAPAFDIPMVVNAKVTAWVDHYSGRHRDRFEQSLIRSGRFLPMIHRVFAEARIPLDVAYMAHVESAFKTRAYSRARAKGMFQFIASTGRRYGLRADAWVDERSDPEKSARAAAEYLKDLHAEFGDWYLALAAYNAGEGKIRRAIKRTGLHDFWGIARTSAIRTETKNYVPAILAATLISKDPSKYGFQYVADSPVDSETAEIRGAVDLGVLSRASGLDLETLKELNPALRRGQTPPDRTTLVRVPAGTATNVLAAFEKIPPSHRIVSVRHVVRKGETLGRIASRYHVSVGSIQRANKMGSRTLLRVGRELVIPKYGWTPDIEARADGAGEEPAAPTVYRVRAGDTLSSIARRFRTTPRALAAANGIPLEKTLRVGESLRISGRAAQWSDGDTARQAVVHTVRRGETLWQIAARYGTSVSRLCDLNDMSREDPLRPGRKLTVRSE